MNTQSIPTSWRFALGLAATAVALFLLWYFSDIVIYILISAVLGIIGRPLVRRLSIIKIRGRYISRGIAALITTVLMWVLFATFFSIFIPLIFNKLNQFANIDMVQVISSINDPIIALQEHLSETFSIPMREFSLTDTIAASIREWLNIDVVNSVVGSFVSTATSFVIALFSITFITFFFLKEDDLFYSMVTTIFPKRYEDNITRALDSVTVLLVRYFTGILAESFIMMIIVSFILLLFGASGENAFFTGLIVGVLNVIPYVGPLIGFSIGLFVGLVSPIEGMTLTQTLLATGGTILTAQGLDNFVLQPVLYSNRVKAHPLEIFIVILIAGNLAGVVGMLLAIPSYTVIRVFAKEFFYNFRLVQALTENLTTDEEKR